MPGGAASSDGGVTRQKRQVQTVLLRRLMHAHVVRAGIMMQGSNKPVLHSQSTTTGSRGRCKRQAGASHPVLRCPSACMQLCTWLLG